MEEQKKVAVVTGASSGIGLAAAKALLKQGWRLIALGRHPERCTAAEAALRALAPKDAAIHMIRADLSLMAEAARAADEVRQHTDRIDVLINNAGGTPSARHITTEGNEATFAGNHLGPFLLTNRLLPLLRTAATRSEPGATRIINVSSSAHEHTPGLDWNNLQLIDGFVPGLAYCNSKLANMLFTKMLSERLSHTGIVVHAMHPGVVDTNFFSHGDENMKAFARSATLISAEEGADTLV